MIVTTEPSGFGWEGGGAMIVTTEPSGFGWEGWRSDDRHW